MVKVYPFLLFSISALGCAATTGRMSYDTGYDDYSRLAGQPERQPDARATGSGIAGGEVLDRAEYVRAVLQSNPSIESARQSWRAALAHVRQAGSFDDPTVDLGIAPLSIGSHAPVGYEVAVSQHLPWFGKRSLDAAATAGEAEAAKSDYETTKRELALVAVTLYDQYFVAERAIEINQRHVELMRVMRASATAQLETGRGSLQDPLQAEVGGPNERAHAPSAGASVAAAGQRACATSSSRCVGDPLPRASCRWATLRDRGGASSRRSGASTCRSRRP